MEEPALRDSLRTLIGCVSSAGADRVGRSLQSPFLGAPARVINLFINLFVDAASGDDAWC